MAVKYVLKLDETERHHLLQIAKGTRGRQAIAQWKVTRAKALLKCDQGQLGPAWRDRQIAEALDVTERSIQTWRKRAVLDGPEAALLREPRRTPPPKVDGRSKRISPDWPARHRHRAETAGPCACWPTKPSNSNSSIPCHTKRYGGR